MNASSGLDHERYMRHCIAMARTEPFALYCSVIVDRRTGEILAEGRNDVIGDHPLVHGETNAIDNCFRQHPGIDWSQLTLYTTAEPCAMCQAAVGWAGITEVVYGTQTATLAALGWDTIDISATELAERTMFNRCTVIGPFLEADCDALFRDWVIARALEQ